VRSLFAEGKRDARVRARLDDKSKLEWLSDQLGVTRWSIHPAAAPPVRLFSWRAVTRGAEGG